MLGSKTKPRHHLVWTPPTAPRLAQLTVLARKVGGAANETTKGSISFNGESISDDTFSQISSFVAQGEPVGQGGTPRSHGHQTRSGSFAACCQAQTCPSPNSEAKALVNSTRRNCCPRLSPRRHPTHTRKQNNTTQDPTQHDTTQHTSVACRRGHSARLPHGARVPPLRRGAAAAPLHGGAARRQGRGPPPQSRALRLRRHHCRAGLASARLPPDVEAVAEAGSMKGFTSHSAGREVARDGAPSDC